MNGSKSMRVTIVAPVYNEEDSIVYFNKEVKKVFDSRKNIDWDIIYIDDGSSDGTAKSLKKINESTDNSTVIQFSRNFGKEIAVTAGLRAAEGSAVIVIDSDLQDPPKEILRMVDSWLDGADVVNMKRKSREGETYTKKLTAKLFYRLINKISFIDIPEDVGDFRLLSRDVVIEINKLNESNRYMKGIFSWVGFKQITLEYDRDPRYSGSSKFSYWKLWNFAIEGISSFSTAPLKIASYLGVFFAVLAISYAIIVLFKTIVVGDPVPGFPTLAVSVLFMGGVQLISIGLIGEYVGRIYLETKGRPLYVVKKHLSASKENASAQRVLDFKK